VSELEIQELPPSTLVHVDGGPPWQVLTEIRERPPSMLKNVDGGTPWEVLTEIRELPPSMLENVNGRPPSPHGGSGPHPGSERCAVTCMGMMDKK
jgi:hypothetical protein